jgi:hypothetical protein
MFRVAPSLALKKLEEIFRHQVFRMLIVKGKITEEMLTLLARWRHSGFHVFCGKRVVPNDKASLERHRPGLGRDLPGATAPGFAAAGCCSWTWPLRCGASQSP